MSVFLPVPFHLHSRMKLDTVLFRLSMLTKHLRRLEIHQPSRNCVTQREIEELHKNEIPGYLDMKNMIGSYENTQAVIDGITVKDEFITEQEEKSLLEEITPYMKRLRYEFDHWDNAIHGYRETERSAWNENNSKIIEKIRKAAFRDDVGQLQHVHILDLAKDGFIKPHVDSVKFCGDTIAGLSLLSDCVMRLTNETDKNLSFDILLKRRSLYIMKNVVRYDFAHEILKDDDSRFKIDHVKRDRRISVICRSEPNPDRSRQ